ncbi:MAG: CerR family C-terminal domain-containing protein [Holophaga sp.]|nr:CerR family C-terminal domain-containing protein [Holophaga sp.]
MKPFPDSSQDTRQRLLEAAILVFAEKGFDGAGIREIALKAKANSALVQYYFGSKEGLYTAALKFLFEQGPDAVGGLTPPPAPDEPEARSKALASLRNYVRAFLEDLFACRDPEQFSREMHSAVHLFWTREMMEPAPERVDMIRAHIQPHVDYLNACIRALRPDLDEEGQFLMGCSIHAQIMFFHRDMAMIALLRSEAYGARDMDRLATHITDFSIRGLGLGSTLQGV